MPNFTWPNQGDVPLISDASLAALLTGAELPPGAAPELRPLAETLAELTGRPVGDELVGEADTLTFFREHFGTGGPGQLVSWKRPRPRRHLPLRAAAATTILGVGGLATAAYAGALPAGLQRLAHDTIDAPAAGAQPAAGPSPAIPATSGQPGYGLCTAWAHAKAHGARTQQAVAFRELAAAAGGPADVTAYCSGMAPPSSHPAPTPSHRSGKPTVLPTPHGSGKPAGHPTPAAG